ncbi:RING finger protein 227 [Latimeria chalumnae]|uniref:RING finger protein 227 n=1 Tax=Latimeria chalumnae TaxID=7897 RepID=UPI0003C166FC|nr:PREDICTED: RING finger protein 224-like [Latimeria chalumnae]|eukprot:XP_005997961.1 PREDICTED: RING finger protein 224-like [Latimeria chalumnae]
METEIETESECGVCYQPYNRGRRAPRLLPCQHTLCTACLRELLRPAAALSCPFCRGRSPAAAEQLPLDQAALERLPAEQEQELEPEMEPEAGEPPRWTKAWRMLKKRWKRCSRQMEAVGHHGNDKCFDLKDAVLIASYITL